MSTLSLFRSAVHRRIVKHPRQLLYMMYQDHERSDSLNSSFLHDYSSTIGVWLRALSNWVGMPDDLNKMGYVIADFEDFLSLNESVRIAISRDQGAINVDRLSCLVRDVMDGKSWALDRACERAYLVFSHEMGRIHVDTLLSDMLEFQGSDLLDWIDMVASYGYLGAFQSHKIHCLSGSVFRDDRVSSLAFRLSSFLSWLDVIKNFMLFYDHCLPEHESVFYSRLKQFVFRFDQLTDRLYMNLLACHQDMGDVFPCHSAATFRAAQRLSELLSQHDYDGVMIGASELDNGRLMLGVSGEGYATWDLLNSILPYLGDDILLAPVLANTMGYQRIVRVTKGGLKTHNGFECVEAKLCQGASNQGSKIRSMTVLWHGLQPKRYCYSPVHNIAQPCPGCMLNLKQYLAVS